MIYDFGQRRFIDTATGRALGAVAFKILRNSPGARAANAGTTTLARAVLVESLVRRVGSEGWNGVLGEIARQGSSLGLDPELRKLFYSQSKDDHAIATYAIFRHDLCTLG
ncbi:hypothetical protein [Candidatus Contendibacter odensensis]|uniref:Uncharacterized protein n=1 Tax=Candidatus Contendobacter odensis Run_B_J11 TaxID=1400861 RepID=A0A7U7GB98_9GAMM|nr:hypothetical protein BN874_2050005 [Candidatus Contendobacter odensis Run_B_J11]